MSIACPQQSSLVDFTYSQATSKSVVATGGYENIESHPGTSSAFNTCHSFGAGIGKDFLYFSLSSFLNFLLIIVMLDFNAF